MKRHFEKLVKYAIRKFVRLLPRIVQVELFKRLSDVLGIKSVKATGESGTIEGSAVDFVMGSYIRQGTWSPELIDVISKRLLPNGTGSYFDIGANIGLTTIPIAKTHDVSCHCFEPEPENFNYLKRNVAMNVPDRDITLHNCALSSRNGKLRFEISPDNKGDHRVCGDRPKIRGRLGEQARETIEVEAKTLDSLVTPRGLPRPIVVKMDVQGSEVEVFGGGQRFFSEADFVIVEFWPYGLMRMGAEVSEFYDAMSWFPFGAILHACELPALELKPIAQVIEETKIDKALMAGKSGNKGLDILLSRRLELRGPS